MKKFSELSEEQKALAIDIAQCQLDRALYEQGTKFQTFLSYVLCDAPAYGGWWHFSSKDPRDDDDYREDWLAKSLINGTMHAYLYDEGEIIEEKVLTLDEFYKGLAILMIDYEWHYHNIITDNCDSETYDCLLQCAVADDIILG